MIPAHAHMYELCFFGFSALAVCVSSGLFTLKLGDLIRVKRERKNGPILFMVTEKIRHQGFLLALSSGLLMLAVSAINNPSPPTPQTLNLIVGAALCALAIVVDGLFTYRQRRRMAELVAIYAPKPGGQRAMDKDA